MDIILYTSTSCPKCPGFRKLLREAAGELGLKEGKDFVEKLIDGEDLTPGEKASLEGEEYYIVAKEEDITDIPAAVGGQDLTIEALLSQVASTPSLVIGGAVAFVGEVPSKEALIEALKAPSS